MVEADPLLVNLLHLRQQLLRNGPNLFLRESSFDVSKHVEVSRALPEELCRQVVNALLTPIETVVEGLGVCDCR